jgi:hypothetical protein
VASALSVLVAGRGLGRSRLMAPDLAALTVFKTEGLKLYANTVTRTWHGSGDVAFNASPDHATVTSYTARLRVSGSPTIVDTEALGKPTPDGNNVIVVALATFFSTQAAGDYTISILATDAGGSTDSAESNPFTLPL